MVNMFLVKDCKSVWNSCLQVIKESVNEQSFKTWFEPIVPVNLQDAVLTIQVPSRFFYEWLEENYVHVLKLAIDRELGAEGRLEYAVMVDEKSDVTRAQHATVVPQKPFATASKATV